MTLTWIVVPILLVLAVLSLIGLRSGGPGPAVRWVPRAMRPRLNRWYQSKGWAAPYTATGERNPDRPLV